MTCPSLGRAGPTPALTVAGAIPPQVGPTSPALARTHGGLEVTGARWTPTHAPPTPASTGPGASTFTTTTTGNEYLDHYYPNL